MQLELSIFSWHVCILIIFLVFAIVLKWKLQNTSVKRKFKIWGEKLINYSWPNKATYLINLHIKVTLKTWVILKIIKSFQLLLLDCFSLKIAYQSSARLRGLLISSGKNQCLFYYKKNKTLENFNESPENLARK